MNRWYGELGKLVGELVGYELPPDHIYLSALVTFEREKTPYPMELRPNLAKALEELGWVRNE